MLEAGMLWLKERETPVNLKIGSYNNVYGIIICESDEAKELEKVIVDAAKGEATGAMVQAVMERLYYINANGWVKYCEELRKYREEEADAARQGNGNNLEEPGETGSADSTPQ